MQSPMSEIAHMAAVYVAVPAAFAFDRLSQADFVGGWALGSMGLSPVARGVFVGQSLFDGSPAHVEILPSPDQGLIDYAVGSATERSPRIFVRVMSGEIVGQDDGTCVVTLHALRSAMTPVDRWVQTCTAHETEILLIKAQLEHAYATMARA